MGLLSDARNSLRAYKNINKNKYNDAFFSFLGGGFTSYDENNVTYIEKGYNINPFVYSVVNQISTKAASIPFKIKKIEDLKEKSKLDVLLNVTGYDLTPQQQIKKKLIESKAYNSEDEIDLPLERPNPFQTWIEFVSLFEVFMKCTGNAYIYLLAPEDGMNAGEPMAWYLLPSHLMQIVLKKNANLQGLENPIDYYQLIEGNQYVDFDCENVVHIKYSNPNYDQQGSHLYGQSPLRAALKNIQSSNEALDLNNKTMKSGGAFGLIHSKGQNALRPDQAEALKERLKEMDADSGRLAKLAGVSAEVGFTRISLTTDELKPFDFLNFDLKQVCAVLGWDDKLVGNDNGAKYDNFNLAQKRVLTGTIIPDLKLFEQAINSEILPRYKKYKGTCLMFDYSDLPEMQKDMTELVDWLLKLKINATVTGNQVLSSLGMPLSDNPLMDELTTDKDLLTLEQSLDDFPNVSNDKIT